MCQYFHPLHFAELAAQKDLIERDIRALFCSEGLQAAVAKLGGRCIIARGGGRGPSLDYGRG